MKISIAMATYNGASFVREQLDSLNAQTRLPYELVICDDGSSDKTISIIEDFRKSAKFKVRIYRNEVKLGYSDNFFKAVGLCEAEWVSFCDQDDVWLPDKLESVAQVIRENPNLSVVLQNAYICDADLNRLRVFPDKIRPGEYGRLSFPGVWVWPGFLQTVNTKLFKIIDYKIRPRDSYAVNDPLAHDKWVCLVANALGGVAISRKPVALYRRHDSAFSGDCAEPSLIDSLKLSEKVGKERYSIMGMLMNDYSNYFSSSDNRELQNCSRLYSKMSEIYFLRERLYTDADSFTKIKSYICIWAKGGYLGDVFYKLGFRSAIKDALKLVGFLH